MVADSSRESGATRPNAPDQPDWNGMEPGLFRRQQTELALARLPQDGQVREAQITPPAANRPTRADAETQLKALEAAKAQNQPYDQGAYMKFHAFLGGMDMDEGKPDQAKEHFKRADAEFKKYFEQADKVFADSKKNNQPVDPAYERNHRIAAGNYMQMVRDYGRAVMVSLNSYKDEDVPDYVNKPGGLATAIQDRRDVYEAYNRALQHAGDLKFPPMLLAEIFQDKGMNAAMLADDLYRPLRLKQEVADVPNWRRVKDASIADLTAADSILDKILGPKDAKLDRERNTRPKPPEAAMEMRAKVLGYLGRQEMYRLNKDEKDEKGELLFEKRADTAGMHFIQALNAWDKYAPLAEGSDVLRTKPIYDNLLQYYNDYAMFAGIMGANSKGLEGFGWAAQVNQAMNNIANIRNVQTKLAR